MWMPGSERERSQTRPFAKRAWRIANFINLFEFVVHRFLHPTRDIGEGQPCIMHRVNRASHDPR